MASGFELDPVQRQGLREDKERTPGAWWQRTRCHLFGGYTVFGGNGLWANFQTSIGEAEVGCQKLFM